MGLFCVLCELGVWSASNSQLSHLTPQGVSLGACACEREGWCGCRLLVGPSGCGQRRSVAVLQWSASLGPSCSRGLWDVEWMTSHRYVCVASG